MRRRCEPEVNEYGERFDRNAEIAFKPLHLAIDAIEPLHGRRFITLVCVGREERGDGGFRNEGAGLMAPVCEVGEQTHYVGIEVDGETDFLFHVRA